MSLYFLSLISPGWVMMCLDSRRTTIYVSQLVPVATGICWISVSDLHSKNLQITSTLPTDNRHSHGHKLCTLLGDIFLYSYEAEFIQSLLSAGKKRLASQFNFTYRYIDDVLSINNQDFENYLGQMYPPELEIKDTTESNTSASYLDLLLSIGRDGQLRTSLYDKRDDFNFHITNFPFLSSNIPSSPAYGVFISQLILYARACSSYECFILRVLRLSNKLLGQGFVKERLKSSLRKFYGRYGDLTKQYEVPLSRMLHVILDDDHIHWRPPLIRHYTNFWPLLIWTLLPNLTF